MVSPEPGSSINTLIETSSSNLTSSFDGSALSAYQMFIGPWLSGSLNAESFISAFEAIQRFLLIFDVIYRVFQTIRIIHKHWDAVASSAPPIDIRAREGLFVRLLCSSNRIKEQMGQSTTFYIALHFISQFWVYIVVIVAFFSIVLSSLLFFYYPIYRSYVNNCVRKEGLVILPETSAVDQQADIFYNETYDIDNISSAVYYEFTKNNSELSGTFLARNLYSMGYNYASMTGSTKLGQGISIYNSQSTSECIEYYSSSLKVYEAQSKAMQVVLYIYKCRHSIPSEIRRYPNIDTLWITRRYRPFIIRAGRSMNCCIVV